MAISKRERKIIEQNFPGLRFSSENLISGFINVNYIFNDYPVSENFEIEIFIPKEYPNEIPIVKEVGGKVSVGYEHRYPNGQLCLGTDSDILIKCHGHISILKLINNCVISYFFSYRYFERFGTYPFGERSHGGDGIIEAYMEILGVSSKAEAIMIINYAVLHQYRGHLPCPCGSGKITRSCHPISSIILSKIYANQSIITALKRDYELLQREIRNYERHRN